MDRSTAVALRVIFVALKSGLTRKGVQAAVSVLADYADDPASDPEAAHVCGAIIDGLLRRPNSSVAA